jgi:mono/diheme cytochrome c family protein
MDFGKMTLGLSIVALLGCSAAPQASAPVAAAGGQAPEQAPYDPAQSPDGGKVEGKGYVAVQKLLNVHCVPCHGEHGRAGFDARSYESVMKGYEDGPLVVAGNVEKSVLPYVLHGTKGYRKMPTKRGIPLSDVQIKFIEQWIKDGAKKPETTS